MSGLAQITREGIAQLTASARAARTTARLLVTDPKQLFGGEPIAPFVVLYGHSLIDSLENAGTAVVFPDIRRDFDISLQGVTALAATGAVLALVLSLPVAYRADRSTRRVMYLAAGAMVAGMFGLATAVAMSLVLFVLARAGLGIGLKINDPVQQSLLADYSPVEVRAAAYSGRQAARSIGQLIGPLAFGLTADLLGWRAAFVGLGLGAFALGLVSLRLREPARGAQERRMLGAVGDALDREDDPPSWEEGIAILRGVGTVRRLWLALPFLAGGLASLALLYPLFLEEVFGLGATARGALAAADEPFAIAGLLFGIPIARRYVTGPQPERMFRVLAVVGLVIGASLTVIAMAPNLVVLFAGRMVLSFAGALILPGLATLFSLVMPARVRTVGFALSQLWILPGLLLLPIIGALGERYGLRVGILAAIPAFVIGAAVLSTAAAEFAADMRSSLAAAAAAAENQRARQRGRGNLLVCHGLDVAYGPVQVLFGVDFEVGDGEMVALLGTNGAGKSTLLRAISGTVQPDNGAVLFDGRNITYAGGAQTAGLGIVQVPGGRGVFPTMTVGENLRVAAWLYRRDPTFVQASMERVLEMFPVLRARFSTLGGDLSGGEQQMLTLAQAFLAKPKLLLIDELSLGLAPVVVEFLLDIVRAINAEGVAVVLVEQSVNVALTVCDRAVFLEKGEVRFQGATGDLLDRPDVLRSVFLDGATGAPTDNGKKAARVRTPARPSSAEKNGPTAETPVLLTVDCLAKRFGGVVAVDGVSFELREREILGLIGQNGAGKTTIFDLVSGFLRPDDGRILLSGRDVTRWSAERRARSGLGRSFQDARLFPSLTVREAIATALERHVDVGDVMSTALLLPVARASEAEVQRRVEELIELMKLGAFRDKFVSELSTGSRRIVDLACTMAHDPRVLLLDEPSSGIAQRETEALGPVLLGLRRDTGISLLVIEHDIPLVGSISDRLIALEAGSEIATGAPSAVLTNERVVASYLGTDRSVIARSGKSARGTEQEGGRR